MKRRDFFKLVGASAAFAAVSCPGASRHCQLPCAVPGVFVRAGAPRAR